MHASVFLYDGDHDDVSNNREDDNDHERGHLKPRFGSGETTNGATRDQWRSYCRIRACVVRHSSVVFNFAQYKLGGDYQSLDFHL